MFCYGRIAIPFHSFSNNIRKSKVFTHSDFKMALSFVIIGSIAATALKFIRMPERKKTWILSKCEKIDQLAVILEYNSKIAAGEFIFHYTINSSWNLKRKFTQIW